MQQSALIALVFLLASATASFAQSVPNSGGMVPNTPPGVSLSGGSTITPAYAGPNALSTALSFMTPPQMQVQSTHSLGYGTTFLDQGQLKLVTNGSVNTGQNMFALEQLNVNDFAAMTFRAPNINSAIPTDVYEQGAIGSVPPLNGGAGATIFEASRIPNFLTQGTCSTVQGSFTLTCTTNQGVAGNTVSGPGQIWAHITAGAGSTSITMDTTAQTTTTNQTYFFGGISHAPAPEFDIMQTGGVDTSGVTNATCSTTQGSATLTCTTNGGTNGQYIWGTGTTYETTVSSGGGTTSITMSKVANATKASQPYSFNTNPVFLQRRVLDASPLGTTNLRDFANGVVLAVDRYNDRIGINTTTPAAALDVLGSEIIRGNLTFNNANATVTASGGGNLALTSANHVVSANDNFSGQSIFSSDNAATGASAQSCLRATTGTANSSVSICDIDQSGSPIVLMSSGSAVGNWLLRTGALFIQTTGGATGTTINPTSGVTINVGQFNVTSMTQSSAAQTGTVCYNSGTGAVTYDATLGCLTSSARFKTDIFGISSSEALATVAQLKPVSFRKKEEFGGDVDKDVQVGFVAEDVAKIDERLTARDKDGEVRGVRYQQLTAILAGAIKELKAENDNLRACNDNWKCRLFGIGR